MHKIPSFLSSEKPIQVVTLQKPNEIFPTSSNQLEVTMKMKRNWKLCILTEIQRNLILKFKKIIFKREKVSITSIITSREVCEDNNDRCRKRYCLSLVHVGINKCRSYEAIIGNYGIAMIGMKEYHKFISTSARGPLTNVKLSPQVEIGCHQQQRNDFSIKEVCFWFRYLPVWYTRHSYMYIV